MTCARRLPGARRPAPSAEPAPSISGGSSSRSELRPGRRRARLFRLLPALALLLGALGLFTAAPATAQTIWSATLTVTDYGPDTPGQYLGCWDGAEDFRTTPPTPLPGAYCEPSGALTDDDFTFDGVTYAIGGIRRLSDGNLSFNVGHSRFLPESAVQALELVVGGQAYHLTDSVNLLNPDIRSLQWGTTTVPAWSAGDKVRLSLRRAPPHQRLWVQAESGKLTPVWKLRGEPWNASLEVHYTASKTRHRCSDCLPRPVRGSRG